MKFFRGVFLCFSLLFFLSNIVFSKNDSLAIEGSIHAANNESDIRIGARIFHGLVPSASKTLNCASCHNVNHIDTLNWNPSALDLGRKYAHKDFAVFKTALMQPTGNVMSRIHQNLNLNDEQVRQVKSYLAHLATQGEVMPKPLITNRIIFILLLLLFIITLVDFTITHKIKWVGVHLIVLLATVVFITKYIVTSAIDLGRSANYQPNQPIKFSHKVHAGQNQTSCLYCHFNAEQSKFAGIPPVNVCTNCHIIVKEGSRSGKFEIAKIYEAIEQKRGISWVKVYNLPDHVYFNHSQHIVAGKIDCIQCHGDVASMDEVVQVNDLSMGWCVKCHRETGVQFDNKFYGKYEQLHKDLKEGKINKVTVEKTGGTDCMKCHY